MTEATQAHQPPWRVAHIILDDGVGAICVALVSYPMEGNYDRLMMALRWNPGNDRVAPWQEDQGWFLVPFTFAEAIAHSLIELHAFGHAGFDEAGFAAMLAWLDDINAADSSMCY